MVLCGCMLFSKYGCLCIKSDDYKSDRFYRHVCTFKTSFLPKEEWTVISIGVSLAFALTPFGHQECLVLWECLLHFGHFKYSKREKLWKNYFVLTLIPLYSSIVLGFSFLSSIGILWLVDLVVKRMELSFSFSIIYMTLIYMIVEYRLVTSFFYQLHLTVEMNIFMQDYRYGGPSDLQ